MKFRECAPFKQVACSGWKWTKCNFVKEKYDWGHWVISCKFLGIQCEQLKCTKIIPKGVIGWQDQEHHLQIGRRQWPEVLFVCLFCFVCFFFVMFWFVCVFCFLFFFVFFFWFVLFCFLFLKSHFFKLHFSKLSSVDLAVLVHYNYFVIYTCVYA